MISNERVIGFTIKIEDGHIASLNSIPRGWSIAVKNSPASDIELSGSIYVGAAAATPGAVTGMPIVAGNQEGRKPTVHVTLETTTDFVKTQKHEYRNVTLVRID